MDSFARELLAKQGVEALGGLAGYGVVALDGAPLLDDLTRRVEAGDRGEAVRVHPFFGALHLVVERGHLGYSLWVAN